MSDERDATAKPSFPYGRLYWTAVVLLLGAAVALTLMVTVPQLRGTQPVAVTCVSVAAVIIAATAVYRKIELVRDEMLAEGRALAKRVEDTAAYHMAIEGQRAKVHADYLFNKAMKEIENSNASTAQLDGLREEIEERLAKFAVDVFRTQEGGTVVPLTRPGYTVT